jgi:suppressor of ftsI
MNDKKYSPTDGPMLTVRVGHYVHWRVVNHSHEIHPFHIHQVHFLVYQENGKKAERPEWLDTVNVAPEGLCRSDYGLYRPDYQWDACLSLPPAET